MSTAQALQEMMDVWSSIMGDVKKQFPNASEEEIYRISKGVMNRSLGLAE